MLCHILSCEGLRGPLGGEWGRLIVLSACFTRPTAFGFRRSFAANGAVPSVRFKRVGETSCVRYDASVKTTGLATSLDACHTSVG